MMAEALGDRGYGYFIPLEDSKDLITPFDCEDLPNCQDDAECQGTANAIRHTSPDLKTNVTVSQLFITSKIVKFEKVNSQRLKSIILLSVFPLLYRCLF